MGKYAFPYYERIATLNYAGNSFAMSAVVIANFFYFNLHYVVGATLALVALVGICLQAALSGAENWHLEHGKFQTLHRLFSAHFWLTLVFQLVYAGFTMWAIVIMYQRHAGA